MLPTCEPPTYVPRGAFVVALIAAQLAAEGFPPATFQPLDADRVTIAKTVDRQVVGCMNELALMCQSASADAGGLARLDLPALHHRLQRNMSSARDYVPPVDLVATRLQQRRG